MCISPTLKGLGLYSGVFTLLVFPAGGHAATNVALGFVDVQYMAYLCVEELVILG